MVLGSSPVTVTSPSPSDFAPASSKEFLDIQATVECGFTFKRVRDITRTYRLCTGYIYIYTYIHTYSIHIHIHRDTNINTHTYIYIYIYIYVCIYTHTYTHTYKYKNLKIFSKKQTKY